MNKADITNLVTVLIMAYGYSNNNDLIFMVGLFALSGAVTNTLAIYMLFEKIPFLYGSGVIENKFKEFKLSIHKLIMEEFFTKENLNSFFQEEIASAKQTIDFKDILEKVDFTPAFDSLKSSVIESPFGGMLGMFGGVNALEPLKEPFVNKLRSSIIDISNTQSFQDIVNNALKSQDLSDDIYEKLSLIVNRRLEELTPKMVKDIINNMIKEHLGWLVLWGAVFGGIFGLFGVLVIK
ncbi:DUF445 domain-containing protein [Aliarcobacter lanthieri]|uniref:DUF445 domain-containing protein n=1 Tax=Arcobacteraceae TaxID=2808963 RepID=UPI000DE8A5E0|nr:MULTISPECIES: DUF445 domain-containing protein [Arcobacteraceae]MBL3520551.1 DUF445 domain-containing protein [Aliarcobacter lanthieri]RBQ27500.1 DUF445 domain-containing protein [Arcobacter sp. CECT 9188]